VDELTREVVDLSRSGNALMTAVSIGVAVIIYGVLVLALRAISKEDLKLMPKGEKIAKILHIS
jgi:stage V sporulation protein B